uniref:Uncharacterized protein n=1 Tax=Cannabis sativa TaxID=3483 RepID=A0A803P5V2_CANSA
MKREKNVEAPESDNANPAPVSAPVSNPDVGARARSCAMVLDEIIDISPENRSSLLLSITFQGGANYRNDKRILIYQQFHRPSATDEGDTD